jgi:hypothetical protein
MVPLPPPLYPIPFAPSSTSVTYITSTKEEIATYILGDCPKLEYLFFGDGPIKAAHHK